MEQESFPEIIIMAYIFPTMVIFALFVALLLEHKKYRQNIGRLYIVYAGSIFTFLASLFITTIVLLPEGCDFGMLQATLDWYIPSVIPISVLLLIASYIRMAADRKN